MSKYTTELRYILASLALENKSLFDFEYPIFDAAYKPTLEQKIVDHYYFNEIGQETFYMFHHYLKTTMNEIMPYYNPIYSALLLDTNPISNYKMSGSVQGTSHRQLVNAATNTVKSVFNDTPGTPLANLDKYASNVSHTDNDNDLSSVDDATSNNSTTTSGRMLSSIGNLLDDYKPELANIDLRVISDLAPCFMLIY